MSLVMRRNDLWWSRDLAGAYFNGVLAGCLRPAAEAIRWVLSPDQRAYVAMRSKQFGCGPGTCSGFCEKAMGAISLDGHILRLACAQFGGRTSNGPLALLVDGFYSILRRVNPTVDGGGFVDDLWFYLTMSDHGECKGLAEGCVHCGATLAEGRAH